MVGLCIISAMHILVAGVVHFVFVTSIPFFIFKTVTVTLNFTSLCLNGSQCEL